MVVMIILLILCLPLILMLSLFTTTNVVSIVVDVPVTGIDVAVEEVVELDLDKGESFEVDYLISPTEASKKDVTFSFSKIGDDKLAEFTVEGNVITPVSYGSALVTLQTVDGGFRDSFEVVVHSKAVEAISSAPDKDVIKIGEETTVVTAFYPEIVNDIGLTYRVKEGEDVVEVSGGGKLRGIGIGTALIEVVSVDNPEARSEFTLSVESSGVMDFVDDTSYLTALDKGGEIKVILNPEMTSYTHSIALLDKEGETLADGIVSVTLDPAGLVKYTFIDEAYVGDIEVRLTVTPDGGEAVTKSCYISRISEISIGWKDRMPDGKYSVDHNLSGGNSIQIDLRPLGAKVSYFATITFNSKTDVSGEIQSGERIELEVGTVYVCAGGYVSLEIEKTSTGVYLVVRGVYEPTLDELASGELITGIELEVLDQNSTDGKITELEPIYVVVY